MSILTQVSDKMQEVLQMTADEAASNTGYVQDSTWISLPDELRSVWKGTGCRTIHKKASIKLHLRFDVTTGAFVRFQLTGGITTDSKVEQQFEPLPVGSLRLADLGYFLLDAFEKLTQIGVFWITRLKVDCKLFDEQGEPSVCINISKQRTQTP